VPSR
jgi:hypothetical protein